MNTPVRKPGYTAAGLVILGIGLFLAFGRAPQTLSETLPVPNGFHELVEAETAWLAATNRAGKLAAIGALRAGLAKDCQMPLATVREVFQDSPSLPGKAFIRGVVELAETEVAAGRSAEAIKLWSDALRFGPARVNGGVAIHVLIALSGEKRVLDSLARHQDRLSPAERRELAATIRGLEAHWEPVSVVFARDLTAALERSTPSQRLAQRWAMFWLGSLKKLQASATAKVQSEARHRALVVLKLEQ